jgi:hypothetical protein
MRFSREKWLKKPMDIAYAVYGAVVRALRLNA